MCSACMNPANPGCVVRAGGWRCCQGSYFKDIKRIAYAMQISLGLPRIPGFIFHLPFAIYHHLAIFHLPSFLGGLAKRINEFVIDTSHSLFPRLLALRPEQIRRQRVTFMNFKCTFRHRKSIRHLAIVVYPLQIRWLLASGEAVCHILAAAVCLATYPVGAHKLNDAWLVSSFMLWDPWVSLACCNRWLQMHMQL